MEKLCWSWRSYVTLCYVLICVDIQWGMPDLRYFGIRTVSSKTTAINRNDIFIDKVSIKAYDHFQCTKHKMLALILATSLLFHKQWTLTAECSKPTRCQCRQSMQILQAESTTVTSSHYLPRGSEDLKLDNIRKQTKCMRFRAIKHSQLRAHEDVGLYGVENERCKYDK
jgi:hypothetical protein